MIIVNQIIFLTLSMFTYTNCGAFRKARKADSLKPRAKRHDLTQPGAKTCLFKGKMYLERE